MFNKPSNDVQVIEKIHNDFDSAGQELVDYADKILKEPVKKSKTNEKLRNLGFSNVPSVVESEKQEEARKYAEEVKERVQYYFKKYPTFKFITREQVKDICKKYGLVLGETQWFIGEIPEKNKLEIADFKIDKEDGNEWDSNYRIVGDKEQFDFKRYNLQSQNGWELKPMPKDPIVLAPVKGGYLIITKWGKEADIEEVQ